MELRIETQGSRAARRRPNGLARDAPATASPDYEAFQVGEGDAEVIGKTAAAQRVDL